MILTHYVHDSSWTVFRYPMKNRLGTAFDMVRHDKMSDDHVSI